MQFPLAKGGHIRYTDGDKNMVRMMASGETAQCGAEGDRQRNSQAKVPMPDETPKTGGNAGPKKQPVPDPGRRIFQVRRRRRALIWRASVFAFWSYPFKSEKEGMPSGKKNTAL